MIEAPRGVDLWDPDMQADAIIITTNGDVNASGRAVMGRGCALEAATRYPNLDWRFGQMLRARCNHTMLVELQSYPNGNDFWLISFPVKHHWHQQADLELIERSARELVALADKHEWETILAPRPGCGNGHLSWSAVRPIIADLLDDRFIIVHK